MATSPSNPLPPRRPMGGQTPPSGGRFQGKAPDRAPDPRRRSASGEGNVIDSGDSGSAFDEDALLKLVREADQISREYHQRHFIRPLARSYRAWRNEHQEGSKYLGPGFRGRSRLFVPKTRAAVRKNVSTAVAAMFATEDVATVSAVSEDDPAQLATAGLKQELLNYRLGRGNGPGSIPWLIIAAGGMMDAQITGVTISKQYWDYETIDTGEMETINVDVHHDETDEYLHTVQENQPKRKTVRDRPMVELIPFENVSFDPAAPWYDPVGLGQWWFVRYPTYVGAAKAMIRSAQEAGRDQGWLPLDDIDWTQGRIEDERSATRRVREGGVDRYEPRRSGDWDLIWICERFICVEGRDLHFWTIGDTVMLSEVRDVEDAYPAHGGERPYKMGLAGIDTHRIVPMSPVDSWQPLQVELNDTTNLRQDALKRSISPLAKVKRGKKVDLVAVARRGQPEAVLQLDQMEDVEFVATPGPNGAAFTETSTIAAVFDELAGVMSTSSVQNSRQLNETVGGMQIMTGAANAVSEFDLRVWLETWAEPVLRQVSKLIDYYESDVNALAIAGSKAKVWQRYKISPTLDDLVKHEVLLRINVGIGSSDPMQRLSKLKIAMDLMAPMFPMMLQQGISPKFEALIEEIMGHAGFKDGMRFFQFGQPIPQEPVKPSAHDAQFEAQLEQQIETLKANAKTQQVAISTAGRIQSERERNQTNLQLASLNARKHISGTLLSAHAGHQEQQRDHAHQADQARASRLHDLLSAASTSEPQAGPPVSQGAEPPMDYGSPPGLPAQAGAPALPQGNDLAMQVMMRRIDEMSHQVNQTDPMLVNVLAQLARALNTMNAPKRVIRDDLGRVQGVAPVEIASEPRIQMPVPAPQ